MSVESKKHRARERHPELPAVERKANKEGKHYRKSSGLEPSRRTEENKSYRRKEYQTTRAAAKHRHTRKHRQKR
jgi:hypothetical protein